MQQLSHKSTCPASWPQTSGQDGLWQFANGEETCLPFASLWPPYHHVYAMTAPSLPLTRA